MTPDDSGQSRTLATHFDRSYRVGMATLFTCLGLIALATVIVAGREVPRASSAARTERLVVSGHEEMLDQQAGFRGYVLTGDERFLGTYRNGIAALAATNSKLDQTIEGNASSTRLLRWRLTQQAWSALAADALAHSVGGSDVADRLNATTTAFDDYENAYSSLATVLDRQRVQALRETWSVVGTSAGLLVAALVVGVLSLRRERRMFGELVLAPVAQMETAARSIAEGRLDTEVETTGAQDLRSLGEDINSMARSFAAERERVQSEIRIVGEESGQLRALLEFARSAGTQPNVEALQEFLCSEARMLTGVDGVVLIDRLPDGELKVASTSGVIDVEPSDDKAIKKATDTGKTVVDATSMVMSLVHGGHVIALMQFVGDTETMDRELLELISIQSATALEAARAHHQAEYLSEHDPLTEAMNRRRFDADLDLELQRAARYGSPVSLMMIDLDHFKSVNDNFGHHVGDRLLLAVARAMQHELRSTDSAYRYGGEEFAIIARQTDLKGSFPIAARVKDDVERRVREVSPTSVTLSIGVASAPEVGHSAAELISRADAALYKAKELGRDRVIAAKLSEFVETS